jgi:hypothetical protein
MLHAPVSFGEKAVHSSDLVGLGKYRPMTCIPAQPMRVEEDLNMPIVGLREHTHLGVDPTGPVQEARLARILQL